MCKKVVFSESLLNSFHFKTKLQTCEQWFLLLHSAKKRFSSLKIILRAIRKLSCQNQMKRSQFQCYWHRYKELGNWSKTYRWQLENTTKFSIKVTTLSYIVTEKIKGLDRYNIDYPLYSSVRGSFDNHSSNCVYKWISPR